MAGELRITVNASSLNTLVEQYPHQAMVTLAQALKKAALPVVRRIKEKMAGPVLKHRSGDLSRSVTIGGVESNLQTRALSISIGSNIVYARIHETGGTILPRRGTYLAIPLSAAQTPTGKARFSPRNAPGPTFVARSKRGNLIIFQKLSSGGIRPLFVLKRSVVIPKRPIWEPSLRESEQDIQTIFAQEIDTAVERLNRG